MKKRNGFTLVELLGVIVVLAILALITIPTISNVINNMRIRALQNSAYGLIEASNLYYAQYGVNSNTRFDISDNKVSSNDTDNLLSFKGSIKNGTVILDKKGKITVCITDGKNSAYKNYNETKVTTVKGKVCNIKDNSSIVYLDDEATIEAYDATKLTELVNDFENRISALESENENLKEQISDKTSIDEIYPIGSVYTSFEDNTVSKVQARFGGVWEQIESGRMLQSTSTTSNQKGGLSNASFTPTGTIGDTTLSVNQMPRHKHGAGVYNIGYGSNTMESGIAYVNQGSYSISDSSSQIGPWLHTSYQGGSQPHTHSFTGNQATIDIIPPYITVYMYKRTA